MPDSDSPHSVALQRQREGQLQLRTFVEQAHQAVAMLDREFRYVTCSEQWLRDFNLSGVSLVGRSHLELFPELSPDIREVLDRCSRGATESREEDLFIRQDGQRMWLRWEVRPWSGVDGDIGGVVIASQDVTERVRMRQRLADSERFLRLILDMLPQSIFWKDVRGKFLGVNRSFRDVTGVEDVLGKSDYDMPWSREQADHFRDCDLQVIQTREPLVNLIETITLSSGETHWLSTSKIPLVDSSGTVTGVLGTFLDVTHIKRSEEAACARLDALTEQLRSPLAGLLGLCQMLEQTPHGEQQHSFAQWLKSSAESALCMLDDAQSGGLPAAGRATVGEPPSVSVEEAVVAMLEALEATALDKGVELVLEGPPPALPPLAADPQRFRQILIHLVSRALHSTTSGHVLLRIAPFGTEALEFRIEHTGAHASATDTAVSEHLVQSLGGTLGQTEDASWFRLPMACGPVAMPSFDSPPNVLVVTSTPVLREILCRQLESWGVPCLPLDTTELSGEMGSGSTHLFADVDCWLDPAIRPRLLAFGALWNIALSSYQQRSTIAELRRHGVHSVLFKPLFRPGLLLQVLRGKHSPAASPRPPATMQFQGRRVLLAEDTLENQQFVSEALRGLGCHVEVAVNGLQALDMVNRAHYDVVLMDCVMPELDGYDATAAIRGSERGRHLPVIGLSGDARRAQHERCLAAGMDDCIAKPVQLQALQAVLERWVNA